MSRVVITPDGKRYLLVRYHQFQNVGIFCEPEAPTVAVPFVPHIETLVTQLSDLSMTSPIRVPPRNDDDPVRRWEEARRLEMERVSTSPFRIFRGERTEDGLMPTLFRWLARYPVNERLEVIRERRSLEARTALAITKAYGNEKGVSLTELQARAAARHYGAPSTFLDFSFDPRVAAFFGHPVFTSPADASTPGTIYCLDYSHYQHMFPIIGWVIRSDNVGLNLVHLFSSASIPYLSYDETRGVSVANFRILDVAPWLKDGGPSISSIPLPQIRRVAAQQGVFVGLADDKDEIKALNGSIATWYLLDFLSRKWAYVRHPHQYEDEEFGICSRTLFPSDGPTFDEIEGTVKDASAGR